MYGISSFIFVTTGSFLLWIVKGFRGSFNDQMISSSERMTWRGYFRFILGLFFWILIIFLISKMISEPAHTRYYKLTPDQVKELEDEMKEQNKKPK